MWLLVIILLAIVLCLAIVVQVFKSECVIAKAIFDFLTEWAIVLGAVATLVLAFAAFWSVNRSIEHEKRIRAENQEVEFKRQEIGNIIQWLQDVVSGLLLGGEIPPTAFESAGFAMFSVQVKLATLARAGDFAVEAAGIFGSDFQANIRKVSEDLLNAANSIPDNSEKVTDELKEAIKQIMLSTDNAIKEAYRLKSEYKL